MRVFVVGTGRCGTTTFYQACKYISNYSCGHETQAFRSGLMDYPDNWIESAAQTVFLMGELIEKYPTAKWVHLVRDRDDCARSAANNSLRSLQMFTDLVIQTTRKTPLEMAYRHYDITNALIRQCLPSGYMTINLETAENQWKNFWDWIGADGDYDSSQAIWKNRRYNATGHRGREAYAER